VSLTTYMVSVLGDSHAVLEFMAGTTTLRQLFRDYHAVLGRTSPFDLNLYVHAFYVYVHTYVHT